MHQAANAVGDRTADAVTLAHQTARKAARQRIDENRGAAGANGAGPRHSHPPAASRFRRSPVGSAHGLGYEGLADGLVQGDRSALARWPDSERVIPGPPARRLLRGGPPGTAPGVPLGGRSSFGGATAKLRGQGPPEGYRRARMRWHSAGHCRGVGFPASTSASAAFAAPSVLARGRRSPYILAVCRTPWTAPPCRRGR